MLDKVIVICYIRMQQEKADFWSEAKYGFKKIKTILDIGVDDGTVLGVPEKAAPDMIKNFISCISNPALFTPTVYLSPEIIQYESKTIIHIHVLPGAEVYSYKKVIYDRVDDADVKVTATAQIAQMYIRKREIFTERKVYPYVEKTDLRLDMLPKLRVMAQNQSNVQGHPWNNMTDDERLHESIYRINFLWRMTSEKV